LCLVRSYHFTCQRSCASWTYWG